MTPAELRALLAKATRHPDSATAKVRGTYSDVTIPGNDLAALLDVADKAKRLADAIYEDSGATQEQHVAAVDLRDAVAKLESK